MSKQSTSSSEFCETTVPSETLDVVFGALAHPARRQILISLHARGGVMTAGEIADRFKHSWPTTTRHLGVLERAGVVEVCKRGRLRFYTLRPRVLVCTGDWLYSWAAHTGADIAPSERPSWTELPYATMRNAIAPEGKAPDSDRADD